MQESSVYRSIFAEGETTGTAETKRSIALNLLQVGLDINVIASSTGLSLGKVKILHQ